MYIEKYWGDFIGGSDDSLNLVAFLEDCRKEEITLTEIFIKIGLDKQNWDFRQTANPLEFRHSIGIDMDKTYDLYEMIGDDIVELAMVVEEMRKELYK